MDLRCTPIGDNGGLIVEGPAGTRLDDLDRAEVIALFKREGLVLFRGFAPDDAAFHHFGARFTDRFLVDPTPERVSQPVAAEVQTVTLGQGPLSFHYEYGLTPFRPDILWLYCSRPADTGGETTACDGVRVWERLKPATRELLAEKRVQYLLQVPEFTWRGFFAIAEQGEEGLARLRGWVEGVPGLAYRIDPDHTLTLRYRTLALGHPKYSDADAFLGNILPGTYPTFRPTFDDGSALPQDLTDELFAVTTECEVLVDWRPGDVAAIDNWRFMHGRRGFTGDRRVLSLTAYADLGR
jgi:alpha-ketoglutarate-dependent taurine dioxygenase